MLTYNDCLHFVVCDRCPNCRPNECEFFKNKANYTEVVRCKECKWYFTKRAKNGEEVGWCRNLLVSEPRMKMSFCSSGERKE